DRDRGRDDAVHRGGHHRDVEVKRVEIPGDVDILGIARTAAGNNGDVVAPVGPSPGLADADLYFHVPSAVPCPLDPLSLPLAPCSARRFAGCPPNAALTNRGATVPMPSTSATISTDPGSSPISSFASRSAAAPRSASSFGPSFPPGNAISPWCDGMVSGRFVRM